MKKVIYFILTLVVFISWISCASFNKQKTDELYQDMLSELEDREQKKENNINEMEAVFNKYNSHYEQLRSKWIEKIEKMDKSFGVGEHDTEINENVIIFKVLSGSKWTFIFESELFISLYQELIDNDEFLYVLNNCNIFGKYDSGTFEVVLLKIETTNQNKIIFETENESLKNNYLGESNE